jgi:ribonuclease BN (tRNA processing enzyme)
LRVTVLGKSPSWQDVGGACSGYLVQDERTTIVLDMGNGVFSKLRRFVDYVDVHGVVISHLHADHFLDLIPYSYALTYAPRQQPVPIPPWWKGTERPAKPQLHVPSGGRDIFRRVVGAWGNEDLIENAFDLREYSPQDELEIGTLRIRLSPVPHYLPTHAVEVVSSVNGRGRLTYGADCSPNSELVEFARDTDLLIIEATLPRPERTGMRGHLTPGEAGQHGHDAGARRLVITHMSDEMDQEWAKTEAERTYGGPVDVAAEGATYDL